MEPTRKPKVRLHKNGHVTISGISYDDARSIMTAASIHNHDEFESRSKARDTRPLNDDEKEWVRRQRWITDAVHAAINAEIDRVNGRPQQPKTVRQWLKESMKIRKIVEASIKDMQDALSTSTTNNP